jgi:RNA polymerase primary sigma factor
MLDRIAEFTDTDPAFIRGYEMTQLAEPPRQAAGGAKGVAQALVATATAWARKLGWGFRKAPDDGAKSFGNARVWATPRDVDSWVREGFQNVLDALSALLTERDPAHPDRAWARIQLREFSPKSQGYQRFMDALGFDDLREHLTGAAKRKSRLSTQIEGGLKRLGDGAKLLIARMDDFNTTGLYGDEVDSTKPFAALTRDDLNSSKKTATAGGAFGLGSGVHYGCSDFSTVLFGSKVAKVKGEPERMGIRVIGRSELTYHELGEDAYAGVGWFGEQNSVKTERRDSVFVPEDDQLLQDLCLDRRPLPLGLAEEYDTGTSVLVAGFSDPKAERQTDMGSVYSQVIRAAAVHFWPAMTRGRLTVQIERWIDDAPDPAKREVADPKLVVLPYVDALEKYLQGQLTKTLDSPGDVVAVSLPLRIPATLPEAHGIKTFDEQTSECVLVIRLADAQSGGTRDLLANKVALVRGTGMVVQYRRTATPPGARPFHAVLLAGTAVNLDDAQEAAEQYLRLSEPPAHNVWGTNPDISSQYEPGGPTRLTELYRKIAEEIHRALKPPASKQSDGPEILKRMISFQPPKPPRPVTGVVLRKPRIAEIQNGRYHVVADLVINEADKRWGIRPVLALRGGEAEVGDLVPWESVNITDVEGSATESGHVLHTGVGTRKVRFDAVSSPNVTGIDVSRCRAVLDIEFTEE